MSCPVLVVAFSRPLVLVEARRPRRPLPFPFRCMSFTLVQSSLSSKVDDGSRVRVWVRVLHWIRVTIRVMHSGSSWNSYCIGIWISPFSLLLSFRPLASLPFLWPPCLLLLWCGLGCGLVLVVQVQETSRVSVFLLLLLHHHLLLLLGHPSWLVCVVRRPKKMRACKWRCTCRRTRLSNTS